MVKSSDAVELKYYWKAWHNHTSFAVKNIYMKYIEMLNYMAKLNSKLYWKKKHNSLIFKYLYWILSMCTITHFYDCVKKFITINNNNYEDQCYYIMVKLLNWNTFLFIKIILNLKIFLTKLITIWNHTYTTKVSWIPIRCTKV